MNCSRLRGAAGAALTLLALAACGSSGAPTSAAPPAATPTATPVSTPAPTPTPTPAPTLAAVPDFNVVAYQGDQVFGGHAGHFAAVFGASKPVVLLYFAGL